MKSFQDHNEFFMFNSDLDARVMTMVKLKLFTIFFNLTWKLVGLKVMFNKQKMVF